MENKNHAKATVILLTAGFEIESDYPPKEFNGGFIDGQTTFTHRNFTVIVPYDVVNRPIRAMFTGHIYTTPEDLAALVRIMNVKPIPTSTHYKPEGYDASRDYLAEAYDDMVARGD